MTEIATCQRCNALYPELGPLDAADWDRVQRALNASSAWLAAGEVKLAKACTDIESRQWIDHLLECPGSWVFPLHIAAALEKLDSAFSGLRSLTTSPTIPTATNVKNTTTCLGLVA